MLWEFTASCDLELHGDEDSFLLCLAAPWDAGKHCIPRVILMVGGIEAEASPEAKCKTLLFILHSTLSASPSGVFLGASHVVVVSEFSLDSFPVCV